MALCFYFQINSTSRSRDTFTSTFDLILHFIVNTPRGLGPMRAKFDVSSFIRSGDMEGVPKFEKYLTTAFALILHFCLVASADQYSYQI